METKIEGKPEAFLFPMGRGIIRSKPTKDAIILYGRISVPHIGPCFINGVRPKLGNADAVMEITTPDRKPVAQLTLPTGEAPERVGNLTTLHKRKAAREVWTCKAVLRKGSSGYHFSLSLDGVRPTDPSGKVRKPFTAPII